MNSNYIFTSARLGFRNWVDADVAKMTVINTDPRVMEYFPALQNRYLTAGFIDRMQKLYAEKGYCYFAVDRLDTGQFIGFTGLSVQTFVAPFTHCMDVGWRLHYDHWYLGFATEGAKRCLEYAFNKLQQEKISAICPAVNKRSEAVMRKLGMHLQMEFTHPLLLEDERLKHCLLYAVSREAFYGGSKIQFPVIHSTF